MRYKIVEVHAVYKKGEMVELAVLWQSNDLGWVRASYSDTKPCNGYYFLPPDAVITESIIQNVAGLGKNIPDEKKKKYFTGKRNWEE